MISDNVNLARDIKDAITTAIKVHGLTNYCERPSEVINYKPLINRLKAMTADEVVYILKAIESHEHAKEAITEIVGFLGNSWETPESIRFFETELFAKYY